MESLTDVPSAENPKCQSERAVTDDLEPALWPAECIISVLCPLSELVNHP